MHARTGSFYSFTYYFFIIISVVVFFCVCVCVTVTHTCAVPDQTLHLVALPLDLISVFYFVVCFI